MTIHDNDPQLIIQRFTDREVNWIYAQFTWQGCPYIDKTEQKRERLKDYMNSNKGNPEQIRQFQLQSKSFLLTDDELEWIKKSGIRFMRWLIPYCSKPSFGFDAATKIPIPPLFNMAESAYYDHIVNALDTWPVDIHIKSQSLNKIKTTWTELLLKDRKLNWLRKDSDSQIDWAWSYLNTYLDKQNQFGRHKYSPIGTLDTYLAIMSTFDTWHGDTGALYLLQTSMKQAWAQQKYRSTLITKKKKQSTYVLGENTKAHLEELAVSRNINLNQMLEHIINEAYRDFKKGNT